MVPPFDPATGLLPPGVFEADWAEVEARFGFTPSRKLKLRRLKLAFKNLGDAGCARALLDGSFVTAERHPNDFDAAWDPVGVDITKLNPVFLVFANERAGQKELWGGEFFISTAIATGGVTFEEFFQRTRDDKGKGIVVIDPRTIP